MPDSQYRVVFLSNLIEDSDLDEVKQKLIVLFGTTAVDVDRLFVSDSVILKKNLRHDEAVRYRDAILGCGGFCRIEVMDSILEIVLPDSGSVVDETMICGRCFREQEKSDACQFCGANFPEYRSAQLSGEGDPAVGEESVNRRSDNRRQDLESSVNVSESHERRTGRDRRRAHLNWRT